MLRQPMNGLASCSGFRYATCLSPPRSSVRIVTVRFGAASITARYAASCSSSDGTVGCVRNRYSVRYRPTPQAPALTAMNASGGPLTLASSSHGFAVARHRLLIAVLDQPVAHVHVLALQLAVGRLHLGARPQIDVSLAAVQGDQVAGLHFTQDAAQARDRGDAERPRQDGGVAGGAAGLGDDAGHLQPVERQRLRRQDFRGDDDDGFVDFQGVAMAILLQSQLGDDAADDITDVGHAFLEVLVLDLAEEGGVLVEHVVQGGAGIDVLGEDGILDACGEYGVA